MTSTPMEHKPSAGLWHARQAETLQNRIDRGTNAYGTRDNKNPHAVALGEMSSPEKAAAAQANGEKGGRPKGS